MTALEAYEKAADGVEEFTRQQIWALADAAFTELQDEVVRLTAKVVALQSNVAYQTAIIDGLTSRTVQLSAKVKTLEGDHRIDRLIIERYKRRSALCECGRCRSVSAPWLDPPVQEGPGE